MQCEVVSEINCVSGAQQMQLASNIPEPATYKDTIEPNELHWTNGANSECSQARLTLTRRKGTVGLFLTSAASAVCSLRDTATVENMQSEKMNVMKRGHWNKRRLMARKSGLSSQIVGTATSQTTKGMARRLQSPREPCGGRLLADLRRSVTRRQLRENDTKITSTTRTRVFG